MSCSLGAAAWKKDAEDAWMHCAASQYSHGVGAHWELVDSNGGNVKCCNLSLSKGT